MAYIAEIMDLVAQARAELTAISTKKEGLLAEIVVADARNSSQRPFCASPASHSNSSGDETTEVGGEKQRVNGELSGDEMKQRGVQKRLIEEALKANSPLGLTKAGVVQWVADRHGVQVTPNYVGVLLDRLKAKETGSIGRSRWVPEFEASGQ